MTTQQAIPAGVVLPPRTLRLSGDVHAPRWRGRLHLAAAVVAVPAGAALFARRPSVPVALYVVGLVTLFAVSAGYHLLPLTPGARRRLRQADHATIYVFTAASMTPLCRYATGGRLGAVVAVTAWVGAGAGVTLKVRGFDRSHRVGGALYVGLGLVAALTLPRSLSVLDGREIVLTGAMALLYLAGAAVLWQRRPDPVPHSFGYHEVWHTAVVAASVCWFLVVWGMVATPH
jgi:hemolysin III